MRAVQATLCVEVGGHALRGERRAGRWSWECQSWPALAARHDGCADPGPVLEEFWARTLGQPHSGGGEG